MQERVKTLLQEKSFFVAILPLWFIYHGYNAFFSYFPLKFVLLNFSITILALTAVNGILYLLVRNKRKAAILCFWISLFALSFGFTHDTIKKLFGENLVSSYKFFLPFCLLGIVLLVYYVRKASSFFSRQFLFLNVLMFVLLGFEVSNSFIQLANYKNNNHLLDPRFAANEQANIDSTINDSLKPDIFFLVFDALPSTKAMKSSWNFDNGELDSFLVHENFYVHADSKSNYNLTVLSVGSTFNMDYSPPVDLYQDETKLYFKASASLLNNSLTRILTKQGYEIKQYQPLSFNNQDWNADVFFENMLKMNYFYQTLPGRIYRDLGWHFSNAQIRISEKKTLKKYLIRNLNLQQQLKQTKLLIEKSCSKEKVKRQMIYAHFQLPHEPFIFDSTGKLKPTKKTMFYEENEQPAAFIEQVKFARKIIKELVLYIKENNRSNTVIIIEGDHGFRNIDGEKGYMIFENFNSIYFPNQNYRQNYQSMSPVNTFRVVLNNYFNAKLPLLKDSCSFIPYTLPGEKLKQ